MTVWLLVVVGIVAVYFWRPEAQSQMKYVRYIILGILALVGLFPLFLYFLLGGNPIYDLYAEQLFFEGEETRYYQYRDTIYQMQTGNITYDRRFLEDVDVVSFELVGNNWVKDANYVYQDYSKTDFDPATFSRLDCYISDGSAVYIPGSAWQQDHRVISTDVENFTVLGEEYPNTCVAKDSTFVYIWEDVLERADPGTFRFLNKTWAIDNDTVFVNGEVIEELSPAGLVRASDNEYGDSFVKNNDTVFAARSTEPFYIDLGADPDTFQYEVINLDGSYWQGFDAKYYYSINGKKKPR